MINQNKARRIIEANDRDRKMMELNENPHLKIAEDYTNLKGKKNFTSKFNQGDDLQDSVENSLTFKSPMDNVIVQEYGDQYNANHDFAIF